jgi:hypothetical protein
MKLVLAQTYDKERASPIGIMPLNESKYIQFILNIYTYLELTFNMIWS